MPQPDLKTKIALRGQATFFTRLRNSEALVHRKYSKAICFHSIPFRIEIFADLLSFGYWTQFRRFA